MALPPVARPARARRVPPGVQALRVASPPAAPPEERGGVGQLLLGTVGSLGMLGFALVGGNRAFLVLALLMVVATIAAAVASRRGQRAAARKRHARQSARWSAHLAERVAAAALAAEQQRTCLLSAHPSHAGMAARAAGGPGLWERRPEDDDAWLVRLGVGDVPARVTLSVEWGDAPLAEHDPELASRGEAACLAAEVLREAPVVVDLAGGPLVLVGPLALTRAWCRALLVELAVSRPPGELDLVVDTTDPAAWQWLAWLPHRVHLAGDRPLAAPAAARTLAVVDRPGGTGTTAATGGPILHLVADRAHAPAVAGTTATLHSTGAVTVEGATSARLTAASGAAVEEAAALARLLAPLRAAGVPLESSSGSGDVRLAPLLGVPALGRLDVPGRWSAAEGHLRVPLGVGVGVDGGREPLTLDLRESADGGDGPHGLLVGATGSGKSELLRTVVLGLALASPPEELALVLVDWKGGAAFDEVSALPHVAGLVTNLADEASLVQRVGSALRGELSRRQRLLRAAGAESQRAYAARRRAGEQLAALPSLVVVIDEFGELLAAEPELLEVLVQVGALGRSLGVHLLLSSQRLEEGRLRGLDSHLRYRVCLRVFTRAESHAVLGVPDAALLPTAPGAGLLLADGQLHRFHAAHTSGPADPPAPAAIPLVRPLRLVPPPEGVRPATTGDRAPSERAAAVAAVRAAGAPAVEAVWLPPLPSRLPLSPLLAEVAEGSWSLPLGRADQPHVQSQPRWDHQLGEDGHLVVVGAPGAGASGLLLTLATSAAALHSPAALSLAAIDLGGGRLAALDALPHTRAVAGAADAPPLLRLLRRLVAARAAQAAERGLVGLRDWREARDTGGLRGLDASDVLLVVDGLGAAHDEVPELDEELAWLAAAGPRVGLHLALSAGRWADVRPALRDLLRARVELRLADPADSLLRHGLAAGLAGAPPGCALTAGGALVQVADSTGVAAELASRTAPPSEPAHTPAARAVEGRVEATPAAPRLVPLPSTAELADPGLLAVREGDGHTVSWSPLGALLVLGDARTGRTTALRRLLTAHASDRERCGVLVVDPRRGLLRAVAGGGCPAARWTGGDSDTEQAVLELAAELEGRLPRAAATPAELLASSAWEGRRHLVVVDDVDLLPGGALGGPLSPLVPLLRRAEEVGLGLVLARSVRGWARTAYDPFLAGVLDSGPAAVLLRGDPAEGPLVGGVRALPGAIPGRGLWLAPGELPTAVQLGVDPASKAEPGEPGALSGERGTGADVVRLPSRRAA